jgi:hypothetical protein
MEHYLTVFEAKVRYRKSAQSAIANQQILVCVSPQVANTQIFMIYPPIANPQIPINTA